MSEDDERCVANPLADGARYHYDISVRPADQWARDEEFATVSSGGAGTRWMIADNLREAAALLDIGRPLEGGRPVDAAAPVAREDTASPDEAARTAPCPDCGAVVGVLDSIPSLSPVIDDHEWRGVLCSGSGATLDRPVPARPTEAPDVQTPSGTCDCHEDPGAVHLTLVSNPQRRSGRVTVGHTRWSAEAAFDTVRARDDLDAWVPQWVSREQADLLERIVDETRAEAPDAQRAAPTRDALIHAAAKRATAIPGIEDAPVSRVIEETVEAVLGVLRGGGADGGWEDEGP